MFLLSAFVVEVDVVDVVLGFGSGGGGDRCHGGGGGRCMLLYEVVLCGILLYIAENSCIKLYVVLSCC